MRLPKEGQLFDKCLSDLFIYKVHFNFKNDPTKSNSD